MNRVRVLLVDDSPIFLDSMSRFLAQCARIEIADKVKSAEEALANFDEITPDFVLTDLVMAPMSGLDLVRRLKARAEPPLVIVLTLFDLREYRDHARQAGADGLLSKHDLTTRLVPMIERLWEKHGNAP